MKITFEIDTENDVFDGADFLPETQRIVNRAMLRIKNDETINGFIPGISFPLLDFYGNTVGTCKIEK